MKVLITGAGGQAGSELRKTAPPRFELHCLTRQQLDISDQVAVNQALAAIEPELIINAAAYTAVDQAEAEAKLAYAVNATGAGNLARAAAAAKARLLHISTDFVFAGDQATPYRPNAPTGPLNIYGQSKLAGEMEVRGASNGQALIIRTGWLYGAQGHNFVKTMLRLLAQRSELGVVCDQIGTPTWARTLARALWAAAERPELQGIYHWSDAGVASWYDFAVAIREEGEQLGLLAPTSGAVKPINSAAYPTPARRPPCSVLDKTASWQDFGLPPRHWRDGLRAMLRELKTCVNC
ncbi:dTDP-4-dehydrorhamnose reductase [Desulfurivibrio sp. D14AmB]|uniref:dTDP-4-dehydrorhamnose reductase n=1 Tax=Desulfurivibrio sp. D14AmB TaxID=3374370 RepID=UPI00376ECFFF